MRRLLYFLPLLILMGLGIFFFGGLGKDPAVIPSALINRPVPDFSLPPVGDRTKPFTDEDLRGQVSLVNIFGSWCVACIEEHPFLMKLKREKIIPVHGLDWKERGDGLAEKWLNRHGDPYTLIGDDRDGRVAIDFGVTGAPETYIVDKNGVIRHKHIGVITERAWREKLWPIIEKLRAES